MNVAKEVHDESFVQGPFEFGNTMTGGGNALLPGAYFELEWKILHFLSYTKSYKTISLWVIRLSSNIFRRNFNEYELKSSSRYSIDYGAESDDVITAMGARQAFLSPKFSCTDEMSRGQ